MSIKKYGFGIRGWTNYDSDQSRRHSLASQGISTGRKSKIDYVMYPKKTQRITMVNSVGKFWVVTSPTNVSTLGDILFQADVPYMMNQARGGLKESEILGIYEHKIEAERVAKKLLQLNLDKEIIDAMVDEYPPTNVVLLNRWKNQTGDNELKEAIGQWIDVVEKKRAFIEPDLYDKIIKKHQKRIDYTKKDWKKTLNETYLVHFHNNKTGKKIRLESVFINNKPNVWRVCSGNFVWGESGNIIKDNLKTKSEALKYANQYMKG